MNIMVGHLRMLYEKDGNLGLCLMEMWRNRLMVSL